MRYVSCPCGPEFLGLVALLDDFPRAVPYDARVVAVGVETKAKEMTTIIHI
jgi:hypothetical protein